ncbi:acid protease [Trametes elegans]|nr:acid protease [Trametes elegans]
MKSARAALLFSVSGALVRAGDLPSAVPLQLNKGFWQGDFTVGPQTFALTIDTGSFAALVKKGLYQPSASSQQTNISEWIQFNGASEDSTGPAQETVFFVRDTVEFAGLTAQQFLVGNITDGDDLPGDGYEQYSCHPFILRLSGSGSVLGLSPPASDNEDLSNGQGIIETFCASGDLSPCQFGVALGKDGHGSLYLGELDKSKISGEITTLPTAKHDTWTVTNSTPDNAPFLVVDGKPFSAIYATFDSGGPNLMGPLMQVRDLLKSVGYDVTEQTNDGITVALGTYDCARTPARIGFSFPPSGAVHYIDGAALELNRTADGKVCTANVLGTSTVDAPQWSIGQTWFQGRYVQHDLDKNELSFADLA